jgi:hypothetical protein
MRTETPAPTAVDAAIETCAQQIQSQTDRLIRQTKAGIDAAQSRALLFACHRSVIALKHAKRALERR